MKPQISVLLSTYNDEKYIAQSIESILKQTFKDYEFIIVNDGSTDTTPQILASFSDDRIKIYDKPNTGMADSWNFGITKCHGKWIARMDGDDVAFPNRLSEQLKKLNDTTAVLGTGFVIIDANGKCGKKIYFPTTHKQTLAQLIRGISSVAHPTAIINREKLVQVGMYDPKVKIAEDYDLWLRISHVGEVKNIDSTLLELRKHNNNISHTRNEDQVINALISLMYYKTGTSFEKMDDHQYEAIGKKINEIAKTLDLSNLIEKNSIALKKYKSQNLISNLLSGDMITLLRMRRQYINSINQVYKLINEES